MSDLRADFERLAEWAATSSPLYESLCRIAADDPALRELAATAPADRNRPAVFLAAVHYLLLRGVDHPLAEYYSSVVADPRDPDADLGPALRDFCETHAGDLRSLLATRRTQTNSVRRSAVLYPAFARVDAETDGPLALVELGPSAGLNLCFDRYRYDYDGRAVGAPDSPVTIRTAVRGGRDPPLPDRPPSVRSRVGIDLRPMDLTDGDDRAWLRALIWPEHADRRRALADAIEAVREDPPRIVEGDLVEDLPAVLDGIPTDVPVCVYSTLVLYQVSADTRARLGSLLREWAAERPLHWLASGDIADPDDGIRMEWTRAVDGAVRTDLLATYEQHGRWIEWRDESTDPQRNA